jgi:hypothetical protein
MAPMQIVELAGFRLPRADLQSGRRRCPPFSAMSINSFEGKTHAARALQPFAEFDERRQHFIYRKLLDDVAIDDMQTAGRVQSDKRDTVCVGLELEIDASRNARPSALVVSSTAFRIRLARPA